MGRVRARVICDESGRDSSTNGEGLEPGSLVMNLDGIHHKWGGVRARVICDESGRDSSQMGRG